MDDWTLLKSHHWIKSYRQLLTSMREKLNLPQGWVPWSVLQSQVVSPKTYTWTLTWLSKFIFTCMYILTVVIRDNRNNIGTQRESLEEQPGNSGCGKQAVTTGDWRWSKNIYGGLKCHNETQCPTRWTDANKNCYRPWGCSVWGAQL